MLDKNKYMSEFQNLPLNLIYSLDDPNDQNYIFNYLICDCINNDALLRKV